LLEIVDLTIFFLRTDPQSGEYYIECITKGPMGLLHFLCTSPNAKKAQSMIVGSKRFPGLVDRLIDLGSRTVRNFKIKPQLPLNNDIFI
jgi:hypothetical protein